MLSGLFYKNRQLLCRYERTPKILLHIDSIRHMTNQQNDQHNDMCALQRLRSAWASTQSDQSFFIRTAKTLIRLGGCPGWAFAGRTGHFVGFVMRRLISFTGNFFCFNPFMPSGSFSNANLDMSNLHWRGVWLYFKKIEIPACKQSPTSNLGLQCLPGSDLWDAEHEWV